MNTITNTPVRSVWAHLARHDGHLFDCIVRRRSERLNRVMILLTRSGDARVYLAAALLGWLIGPDAGEALIGCAIAAGLAAGAGYIPKRLVARPRPARMQPGLHPLLSHPDAWSFPSSHTASAFAVAIACASGMGPIAGVIAVAWATLVGISRIYVGAHYPLDVTMGALLGSAVSLSLGFVRDGLGHILLHLR